MAAIDTTDHFSSPVGSFPSTASVSETIDDQSGTYSGHWDAAAGDRPPLAPIAICGIGLRLPGGIRSSADYWDLLFSGRDARGPVPANRYNVDGFDQSLGGKDGIRVKHGYFLDEELSGLDTSFFTLTKNELEKTDPQQRILLEVTREALEDAAEINYRGGLIGCYVGTFGDDWLLMSAKETAQAGGYMVTGHGDLMMANRVSYEYDFRGPSMAIKTGCSASLVALHEACRAIQSGDATAAIVAGTSMIMTPTLTATMAGGELLAPDGSCKTFDASADGFARAEAVTAIYVKRLEDAIQDGNPIRAVIRASATNSDGKGKSLVTPNGVAQEALMRKAYADVGLDPNDTAYVECHGTGTPTGDPIEVHAVGEVFGGAGVLIGSVKPNLGHSEGSSGVSSVIKCVLALEHKTIPPNIKFNNPNPKIAFDQYKLTVPVIPTPFPSDRAERISINSFGIGGTNAHIILESCNQFGGRAVTSASALQNGLGIHAASPKSELLLFSANSETSLTKQISRHADFVRASIPVVKPLDIAYTRAARREHFTHRSFAILSNGELTETASGLKAPAAPQPVVLIFSGQGAQWPEMGKGLVISDISFRKDIARMDTVLQAVAHPPSWKLLDELLKPSETSQVHKAELSQPLCTALQIALFNKYAALGLKPEAVVGHSSGEIAAAYASGYLSMEEAIIIAYYRGYVTTKQTLDGGMAAVGLGGPDLERFLKKGVVLACENSPGSSTISGDRQKVLDVVAAIKEKLPETFARPLKVDMAYHSHHMTALSKEYQQLQEAQLKKVDVIRLRLKANFFSSVTTKLMDDTPLGPSYWTRNLTSPVRFSSAIVTLLSQITTDPVFLEVGPHAALAGPLRQICAANSRPCNYISSLTRARDSRTAFLESIGKLYQNGLSLDFTTLFGPAAKAVPGLPTYPWDHSATYWHESRISRNWRARPYPTHCLLGTRVLEAAETEPQWRNILCLDDEPWLADHRIQADVVFPFAGYVTLAGEALRQLTHSPQGTAYRLRHVVAHSALLLPPETNVELVTTLRHHKLNDGEESEWYEFAITSYASNTWTRHCDGRVGLLKTPHRVGWVPETLPRKVNCTRLYEDMAKVGFVYGPEFKGLTTVTTSTTEELAMGTITNRAPAATKNYFTLHPGTIDSCFQILLAAKAKGLGRKTVELSVPTAIEELEICTGAESMHVKAWNQFGDEEKPCIECVADGKLVLRAAGMLLRPIADDSSSEDKDVHAAARLQWMPDFDFVDVATLFRAPPSDREETTIHEELTLLCIAESAVRLRYLTPCQPHFAKFRDWLNQQVGFAGAGAFDLVPHSKQIPLLTSAERVAMIDERIAKLHGKGRMAVMTGLQRIYNNVDKLFTGEADTLEILLQDQALARIYDVIGFDYSDFIRILSHTRPQLRILEVGAGTGGTTETILRSLADVGGLPSYACYTFTDVSAGFFPAARERFSYARNLEFKVFDISRDPMEQGFVEGSYDLILAANVIHATPSLEATLRNLNPLLKSDGMLVMTEISSVSRGPSYIFGNFSGWWLGEDDGRPDKPHVSVDRWDQDLRKAGFNGVDTVVYDEEEPYTQCCVIVSRKATEPVALPKKVALLTAEPAAEAGVAADLTAKYRRLGWEVSLFDLQSPVPAGDVDIISTLDLEENFFEAITAETLAAFQALLHSVSAEQTLLWLTPPSQIACTNPQSAQTIGVARTIRSELALRFATLELAPTEPALTDLVAGVFAKVRSAQDADNLDADKEFAVHDGAIHVGRYHPFHLAPELAARSSTPAGAGSTAVALDIGQQGMLETLAWRAAPLPAVLADGHVEIAVRAAGLNFRDVVYAMGLILWNRGRIPLGMEVSGVVTRVRGSKTGLRVGDRVMAFTHEGGFATRVVVAESYALKIPDGMTHQEAATIQGVYATVVYALLDVGRLRKGMSVLVHSACGGVGLSAMQVCRMASADVYCTVGSERKVKHLMDKFDVPRERIFSSRDAGFLDGVMALTKGEGVDLVLNSLPGELLHASWRCVAKNGKLLELGKRDLSGFGKLDMSLFLNNRSYCGVDVAYLVRHQPQIVRETLQRTLELCAKGLIGPLDPITAFDAVDVKKAFRHLQGGEHIGKIILNMPEDPSVLNAIVDPQPTTFSPDAAYLLVGGAGGLGRSLAIWLLERGAKQLVFLSRSAGTSEDSQHLQAELESMGGHVTMVTGSVNDIFDVDKAIDKAPAPIKGVFHLAMVQRDAPFISMSWPDWMAANEPKVKGTWNLHNAFQRIPLDFFWLASSTVTVVDQPGQGNYKAGSTFIESFAQYRRSLGQPAAVLSICPIDDVGFVADNPYAKRNGIAQGMYFLSEAEFLDAVEATLLVQTTPSPTPAAGDTTPRPHHPPWHSDGHIVMGLRSDLHLDDARNPTNWRRDRRMGLYHNSPVAADAGAAADSTGLKAFLARLPEGDAAAVLEEEGSVEFLAGETGRKIYDFLLKPDAAVDTALSLAQMGLDSLTAIELRRWFRQAFGLQVSVLEIMGSASLLALGETVAGKLKEKYTAAVV